jgi:hypothetical protein
MGLQNKNINCEGSNLHIIGSMHAEQNMFSRNNEKRDMCDEILNELNRIKPTTIFIETPPNRIKDIPSYKDKSPLHTSIELIAVSKYISDHKGVNLVGVDSKSLRDLYTKNSSEDMIDFTHLTRNNAIAYNTLVYLRENTVRNSALIIGRNHMDEVLKILSE